MGATDGAHGPDGQKKAASSKTQRKREAKLDGGEGGKGEKGVGTREGGRND